MASETAEGMDNHDISPVEPHIIIPPSEMFKISEMLKKLSMERMSA